MEVIMVKSRMRLFIICVFFTPHVFLFGADFEPIARRTRSAYRGDASAAAAAFTPEESKQVDEGYLASEDGHSDNEDESRAELFTTERRQNAIDLVESELQFVVLSSPYLSDTKVINALIKAHERGVKVTVLVGGRAKGIERLQRAGIAVTIKRGLHAKLVVTSKGVLVGSDNFSEMSALRPQELMVKIDDPDQALQLLNQLESSDITSPGPTPKKRTPRRSRLRRGHTGYKARRLFKLRDEPDAANSLDIFSMTFDSDRIVSTIEKIYRDIPADKHPRVRLFLDYSALRHTDLLDRMQKAGGDKLEIYIFNTDKSEKVFGRIPQIMHQKAVIRTMHEGSDKEDKYVIISTGNLTGQSHREFNIDSHHPHDDILHDQLKALADKYTKSPQWTKYILEE